MWIYSSELSENWGNNQNATSEGVTFYVKYLGSTLLEELEEGRSYGNKMSAEAVHAIVTMVIIVYKAWIEYIQTQHFVNIIENHDSI